jgi:glyoxylase-like metal-dependent hydrolase (beta-lactamase superfamily II)
MAESGAESYGHPIIRAHGIAGHDDGLARRQFYIGILEEFGVPEGIRGEANSLYNKFRRMIEPFQITHPLNDGETVENFEIHGVPGHSPSDALLVDREMDFAVVGDYILTVTLPNPLLRRPENGEEREKALIAYIASLRKSRELGLGLCLPGHGEPFDNPTEVIDGILAKLERRNATILKLVARGKDTPYLVARRLFPRLPVESIHLGLSIAVGHMEAMEEDGRLNRHLQDGVLHFTPA